MKFQVSHKPGVIEQIRILHETAMEAGQETKYVQALKQMVKHLETHPLEWGDPEYRQIHEGSVVCHGVVDPVFVRFAVYEIEEKVYILDIKWAGGV
jgi:hypothetical protein